MAVILIAVAFQNNMLSKCLIAFLNTNPAKLNTLASTLASCVADYAPLLHHFCDEK
jgi:hypothetical protein